MKSNEAIFQQLNTQISEFEAEFLPKRPPVRNKNFFEELFSSAKQKHDALHQEFQTLLSNIDEDSPTHAHTLYNWGLQLDSFCQFLEKCHLEKQRNRNGIDSSGDVENESYLQMAIEMNQLSILKIEQAYNEYMDDCSKTVTQEKLNMLRSRTVNLKKLNRHCLRTAEQIEVTRVSIVDAPFTPPRTNLIPPSIDSQGKIDNACKALLTMSTLEIRSITTSYHQKIEEIKELCSELVELLKPQAILTTEQEKCLADTTNYLSQLPHSPLINKNPERPVSPLQFLSFLSGYERDSDDNSEPSSKRAKISPSTPILP